MITEAEYRTGMLTAICRSYTGTPFEHQGRRPGLDGGLDCVGMLVCGCRQLGWEIEDCTTYARDPNPEVLLGMIAKRFDLVPHNERRPDDILVFYEGEDPSKPQHLALYTGTSLIHAFDRRARKGRVREEPLLPTRMARLHSVWRYRWQQSS